MIIASFKLPIQLKWTLRQLVNYSPFEHRTLIWISNLVMHEKLSFFSNFALTFCFKYFITIKDIFFMRPSSFNNIIYVYFQRRRFVLITLTRLEIKLKPLHHIIRLRGSNLSASKFPHPFNIRVVYHSLLAGMKLNN